MNGSKSELGASLKLRPDFWTENSAPQYICASGNCQQVMSKKRAKHSSIKDIPINFERSKAI